MALTPYLSPLTFPAGTEIPGTMQGLANLLAQYLAVNGLSELGGINFGPTTPSEANRDKPWFKTDGSYNPIGFFSWNGSAWVTFDTGAIPSGPTASRLTSPAGGTYTLGTFTRPITFPYFSAASIASTDIRMFRYDVSSPSLAFRFDSPQTKLNTYRLRPNGYSITIS